MGGARATVVLVTRSREASYVVTQRQLTRVDSIEEEGKSSSSAAVAVSAPPTFTSPFFHRTIQRRWPQPLLLRHGEPVSGHPAAAAGRETGGWEGGRSPQTWVWRSGLVCSAAACLPISNGRISPNTGLMLALCSKKNKEGYTCKIATIVVKRPSSERICSSALCSSWRHHMRRNTDENFCCLTSTFATVTQLEGKLYW